MRTALLISVTLAMSRTHRAAPIGAHITPNERMII